MMFDTHSLFPVPISIKHSVLNITNDLINISKSFESGVSNNQHNTLTKNYN